MEHADEGWSAVEQSVAPCGQSGSVAVAGGSWDMVASAMVHAVDDSDGESQGPSHSPMTEESVHD